MTADQVLKRFARHGGDRIGRCLRVARPPVVGDYQPHAGNAAKVGEESERDELRRLAEKHRG
jgi:hypothetical protein